MLDATFDIDRGLDAVLQHGARYDPDRRYVDSKGTRRAKLSLSHEVIVSDLLRGVKFKRENWVFGSYYSHPHDCYEIFFSGPDVPHCLEGNVALEMSLVDLASVPKDSKILERFSTPAGTFTVDQLTKMAEQLTPAIGKSAFDPHVATWVGSPQVSGGYPNSGQYVGSLGTTSSLGAPDPGSIGSLGGTSFTVNTSVPQNCNEGALYFHQGDQNFRRMINGTWTVLEKDDKLVAELLGME